MDCEKVKDRFSSLWEKELALSDEKTVRDHLSSCPECQKEFEQFEKTMRWLRSVGEEEIPEGFLAELYQKMEVRKRALPVERARGKWSIFPPSFKLPAQAAAMVTIVFLVLYLTKMIPLEVSRPRKTVQPSSPVSEEKKSGQVVVQKKTEKERRALNLTPGASRSKNIEPLQGSALGNKEIEDPRIRLSKEEGKKQEVFIPKSEGVLSQQVESKEGAGARMVTPGPNKLEEGFTVQEKSLGALRPSREIILKVADREKAISQLQDWIKHFGGGMLALEGDSILASLPSPIFSEFEEKLAGLGASIQADEGVTKKQIPLSDRTSPKVKGQEEGERSREPAKRTTDQEGPTVILIHLIQE